LFLYLVIVVILVSGLCAALHALLNPSNTPRALFIPAGSNKYHMILMNL
jgi:hypothetical protein